MCVLIGIIGPRAYQLTQLEGGIKYRVIAHEAGMKTGDAGDEIKALNEYFQLNLKLGDFISHWSSCDERFKAVKDYYPGARLLRQDPVECLFSFVCSSNNNIARIHGMVNTLCRLYGSELVLTDADTSSSVKKEEEEEEGQTQSQSTVPPEEVKPQQQKLYMFPTLEQLSRATEEELRANGFGYRAKFITGSVMELNSKPEGGDQWLRSLRDVPYKEASDALITLPGIGPKVAACVCLFSLDKYQAIPVDTHVWRLVKTHYRPDLQEKKSLTPRLMEVVENTLIETFGPHAGWAHNVLFLSELAKKKMPEKLQTPTKRKQKQKSPKKTAKRKL
jgi:3-methyladenine DNA glycosylase/8-oxoguanine DNA glycosylase